MSQIKLDFLTEDEKLREVCRLYWAMDKELNFIHKTSHIAKKFDIPRHKLYKIVVKNCNAYSNINVCENCKKPYIYKNRTDFSNETKRKYTWQCPECLEKKQKLKREQELQIEAKKRDAIYRAFSKKIRTYESLERLAISLESAVYLLALIRAGAAEDFSVIKPFNEVYGPLSPSVEYDSEILSQLYNERLIFIHPNSPTNGFEYDEDHIPIEFFWSRVAWSLPKTKKNQSPNFLIAELETICRTMKWPGHWQRDVRMLWKKIALAESIEYLKVSLDDHGFSFSPGKKTHLVFNNVLENFSVAEVYNMIWRAVRDAAAFYMREQVSRKHAANTVIGSIQRYAERARAEGWNVKKYGRDRRCPQSLISQVFFNTVLQIGEKGFNESPGTYKII